MKKPSYYHDRSLGQYMNFKTSAWWSYSKARNCGFRAEWQSCDINYAPEWPLPMLWWCHFWLPNLQHRFTPARVLQRCRSGMRKENAGNIPLQHHLAFHKLPVLLVWKRVWKSFTFFTIYPTCTVIENLQYLLISKYWQH